MGELYVYFLMLFCISVDPKTATGLGGLQLRCWHATLLSVASRGESMFLPIQALAEQIHAAVRVRGLRSLPPCWMSVRGPPLTLRSLSFVLAHNPLYRETWNEHEILLRLPPHLSDSLSITALSLIRPEKLLRF